MCHRQIPVIQQWSAITNRAMRLPNGTSPRLVGFAGGELEVAREPHTVERLRGGWFRVPGFGFRPSRAAGGVGARCPPTWRLGAFWSGRGRCPAVAVAGSAPGRCHIVVITAGGELWRCGFTPRNQNAKVRCAQPRCSLTPSRRRFPPRPRARGADHHRAADPPRQDYRAPHRRKAHHDEADHPRTGPPSTATTKPSAATCRPCSTRPRHHNQGNGRIDNDLSIASRNPLAGGGALRRWRRWTGCSASWPLPRQARIGERALDRLGTMRSALLRPGLGGGLRPGRLAPRCRS
jgi:hypothetical protein